MGCFVLMIVLLALAAIVLSPLGLIWSLNTLFSLAITYTLKNWFAALVLMVCMGGIKSSSTGSK